MSRERPDDLDRGAARRREMLGDAWVERSLGQANSLNAEFQSLVTRHAWHEIWCRPGLDDQTRRLLVLGMTMGQARWEEFELHCRAALRGGVPLSAIKETLLQGAIYCGVPAANTAFKLAATVCQSEGIVLDPAPLTAPQRVETHHTFSLPQLRVALQGAATGVPVVLSHALGLDLHLWDALAAELAPQHPVLRFDHRGQGGSAPVSGAYGIDELVADAARVVTEWGRGPVVYVGLSMGGLVGQGLALRHPQLVQGLMLANTCAAFDDMGRDSLAARAVAVKASGMAEVVESTLARFLAQDTQTERPELAQLVRDALMRADPQGYAAAAMAIRDADWRSALAQIACPTVVVSGALDLSCTPQMGDQLAQAIPGARHLSLTAAHLSVLDRPHEFAQALRVLLQQVGAAQAT